MALGMRGAVPPWALVPRSGGRSRPPASSHSFSALPALKPLPAEEEELALFRQYREKRYSRSGDKNDKAIRGNRERRPPPMEPHFHMETIRHNDGLDGASCDTVQSHGPAARVSMAGQNTKISFSVHEPTGPATRVPMVRQNPKVSFEPTVPAARVPIVRQNPHVSFPIEDIGTRDPQSHGARPAFMQNFPRRQFPQFQPRSAPPEFMTQGNVKEYAPAEDFLLPQNPWEISFGRVTEDAKSNGQMPAAPQLSVETKLQECKEIIQNGTRKTARVQMERPVEIKSEPSTEEIREHPVHEKPISIEAQKSSAEDRLQFDQPESTLENHAVNEAVLVVDNESVARNVVELLMGKYKDEVHACDTEVAGIDVKKESPVGHGHLICFSIYCGPKADFGGGKCRIWVDVLKGGQPILDIFRTYLEDSKIRKVWHNYSFDKHILGNHGIKASGFYADTMHLARLWDSARAGSQGGYSLEALTSDSKVMEGLPKGSFGDGKTSMKDLFAKTNIKKDGTEGKLKVIPPVEELQESEDTREKWIHYSAYDAVCTWHLWLSLRKKLKEASWYMESIKKGNMYDFYEIYWREFGDVLVQMEAEGMLVDRTHLAEVEKIALTQKQLSVSRFQKWASSYCADAIHMNVCSDAQIRQLLFGGSPNKKDSSTFYPKERTFKIPNTENFIEAGGKVPKKHRSIILKGIDVKIPVDSYTPSGWPAVNGAVLKSLAGNVAVDYEEEEDEEFPPDSSGFLTSEGVEGTDEEEDLSIYGKAYEAFGGGEAGKRACMAFAALCELSSIDTLISNFIQPLQCGQIVGADGRVHCSLNINTETGRLSARRPNLQNQPALEKDRYKIRHAFVASPGKSLIVADYGQLELRILAHLTGCQSMLEAFEAGGDFHSRTALNMYPHVRQAVNEGKVLLEWDPKPGETKPPVPLLKDMFGSERRKAKMLNFSIAYGKTAMGLSKDWKVSVHEAQQTLDLWYNDRSEVRKWQHETIERARVTKRVQTLLGRSRHLPDITSPSGLVRGHLERAAINTPVQGSAADVAMCAMLEINRNLRLRALGWKLILQVHDEVILEGPSETCAEAKDVVVKCMQFPFNGENFLRVKLDVDADFARSWYEAK